MANTSPRLGVGSARLGVGSVKLGVGFLDTNLLVSPARNGRVGGSKGPVPRDDESK